MSQDHANGVPTLSHPLEELRTAEARWRSLVENNPDFVYLTDRDSTIRYINHSHLGRIEEVIGQPAVNFALPEYRAELLRTFARVWDSGETADVEVPVRTLEGEWRWFFARVAAIRPDGQTTGLVCVSRDLTERKRTETKLLETQKLESLGVLAGGIAHDFNNLLTGILGNANLARLDVAPSSPAVPYIEQIEKICLRAAELCKQMLAYAGKGRFFVEPLDLGQLVADITHLLQVSVAKTSCLTLHLAHDLPAVQADATQMRQMVMNLVLNASEACEESRGRIGVRTGRVHVDADYKRNALLDPDLPEKDYVFLEVSDNGAGMTAEVRARIFDPFFTTKFTGRGLGLAAVQGIVRAHRGAIQVSSEPGRGSTFQVLLPCAEGRASTRAATGAPHTASWRGDGTILVVDDDERVRVTAVRLLESLGFQVVEASDGQEALDYFRVNPDGFRLVLLDLTMPRRNGEETLRDLRALRPDQRVLLMSGYSATEVNTRFAGKGLAGFLQKPFHLADLIQQVRSALGG